ncbi:SDR family NAD(P)-dependent oxidoreductase [Kordiimonas pumila]|uniref:SDR family NAD(P)-dependent oxidoreductase n=1 Tax=Kordiimonas pumila TaxID=2161677 RepID=A0ABV7D7Y2_9PROT|nr:SDR family oxidoreductase [Kordiimonas pumila]
MTNEYVTGLFSLEGKVALVAGASSGIGAGFAMALARAGADVALGARRTDRIEALAAEIMQVTGQKAIAVPLDVADGESVKATFDKVEGGLGTPTIIANNAGIAIPKWALDYNEEDWDTTMDINLKGMWRVGTEATKRMVAKGLGGSIVNTASILGLGVSPQQLIYATSKAAVIQMTKAMALEWQRYGVRVNALCPGYFKTEINAEFIDSEHGQKMVQATPAHRSGDIQELIPALLMLASPASSFTTGVALPVDGAHSVKLV